MAVTEEARYRLRLAHGFVEEARQDVGLQRWRSCVDNSQLAVENAAKAVLALLGPVGRTHAPGMLLQGALEAQRFPEAARESVRKLAECARLLGPAIHAESDYGDETQWRTPWEIFGETDAQRAFVVAEEAVSLANQLIAEGT